MQVLPLAVIKHFSHAIPRSSSTLQTREMRHRETGQLPQITLLIMKQVGTKLKSFDFKVYEIL